ncbi:adenylate/guanylate cyclase domain-containing protein [Magnetococcales bacterium HHB-1]
MSQKKDHLSKRASFLSLLFVRVDFKISIVLIICGLTIPTALIIGFYSYFQSKESSLTLAQEQAERMSALVMQKSMNYFQPAKTLAQISANLFKNPELEIDHMQALEHYLLRVVQAQKGVDYLYYGRENGHFIQGVWLRKQNEYAFKMILRNDKNAMQIMRFYDPQLKFLREEVTPDPIYDPRKRPWYIGAKKQGKMFWTDTYVFFTTKEIGITAADPVFDAKDNLIGVMGADMSLAGLSAFVKENRVSKNSLAFIIDENDAFIAYPEFAEILMKTDKGKLKSLPALQSKNPWVRQAMVRFKNHQLGHFSFSVKGQKILSFISPFPQAFGKKWHLFILIPEDDFIGHAKKVQTNMLLISLGVMVIATWIGILFANRISKPIEALTTEVGKIKQFKLDEEVNVTSKIHEIDVMSQAIGSMKRSLSSFRRYVPADLVRTLIESGIDVKPGGEEKEVTLFFSDIAGFTSISEQLPPRQLMEELSEYMEEMTLEIRHYHGTIDKYIGDAIMAFWGAPQKNLNHAHGACFAALASQKAIRKLNQRRILEGKTPFITRIGLHSDITIIGNMGSNERLNYTALGDSVNLAARLEGVNKNYGTDIIVSQKTFEKVQEHFLFRPLDIIAVRGKKNAVTIYHLMGHQGVGDHATETLAAQFMDVFNLYCQRQWSEALQILESLAIEFPEDQPVKIYRQRCKNYIKNEPGDDWQPSVQQG